MHVWVLRYEMDDEGAGVRGVFSSFEKGMTYCERTYGVALTLDGDGSAYGRDHDRRIDYALEPHEVR
jgi:hypothetical protein